MRTIATQVFDCSLRDGEQQPMLSFRDDEKIALAYETREAGLAGFELMPSIDEHERILIRFLSNSELRDQMWLSTMCRKDYIDSAIACGGTRLRIFEHVSESIFSVRGRTREEHLRTISECVSYARSQGVKVAFVGGDGTRADQGFLDELLAELKPKIEYYLQCDTFGILTPDSCEKTIRHFAGKVDVPVFLHCHNDSGNAPSAVAAGVLAGAVGFDGCFLGIGERAGNVAIEKVLQLLRDNYSVVVEGIDYDRLGSVVETVRKMCGGVEPPKFAESGFYPNKSGIHARLLIGNRSAFNLDCDQEELEGFVYFGKHSGKSNYRLLFGDRYSDDEYKLVRDWIKRKSRAELRDYSAREVREMLSGVENLEELTSR